MKDRIIEILKERGETNLTLFLHLMPECQGEYAIYLPLKEGMNPNILLLSGVKQEFIKAYSELLVDDKIAEWKPVSLLDYFFDCSPYYKMELCRPRHVKTKKHVWLPTSLKLINP